MSGAPRVLRCVPFDPSRYVAMARAQCPDDPWLAPALAACREAWWESPAYVYLVDPAGGIAVERCIQLEEDEVQVVVDVLADDRVGGLELLHELYRLTT